MLHILGELSFILTYFFVASNKTTIYNNMASTKTKLHLLGLSIRRERRRVRRFHS